MRVTSTRAGYFFTSINWRDYLALCKIKVVVVMLITSIIGMLLASTSFVGFAVLFWGNLGIALCACAAAAVNHVVDREIDAKMSRTHNRPIASGKVPALNALLFAAFLALVGQAVLIVFVNELTAYLTLASLLGYALVYTLFLKRATPQNIVIGGIAGAAPPLLGWTAVTNSVDGGALLLVLIIFAWTPPHFWALAVYKRDEYAKAGVPMLPVTHGIRYTKLHILFYTLILFAVSLLPFSTQMFSWIYLFGAVILGFGFLLYALKLLFTTDNKIALSTFKYSINYLLILFVFMLLDHYLLI